MSWIKAEKRNCWKKRSKRKKLVPNSHDFKTKNIILIGVCYVIHISVLYLDIQRMNSFSPSTFVPIGFFPSSFSYGFWFLCELWIECTAQPIMCLHRSRFLCFSTFKCLPPRSPLFGQFFFFLFNYSNISPHYTEYLLCEINVLTTFGLQKVGSFSYRSCSTNEKIGIWFRNWRYLWCIFICICERGRLFPYF